MPRAPTVEYQLFWRELEEMALRISSCSREEKDENIEVFIKKNSKFITIGINNGGIVEIVFHRNMENYLRRRDKNVDIFKNKFIEFAKRRYGSGREAR